MRWSLLASISLMVTAIVLTGRAGRGGGLDEPEAKSGEEWRQNLRGRPMSAQAARTWIALHETTIKPLPDRTPLREVLRALQDATRGKAGQPDGVSFRVVPEALLEAETTLDVPVTLPFVGRPEVSVDVYLKYLLHQFVWERYVRDGSVVIDSPCDDCEGYATVGAPEAHTRLLLHEIVPLRFPRGAPLGEVLMAITTAIEGKGPSGRGLVIYPDPSDFRMKAVTLNSPVTIDAQHAELGDSLRAILKQVGLGFRVLSDGTVMITEPAAGREGTASDYDFPQYRFSNSFLWHRWVEAQEEASRARRGQKNERESARP